MPYGHVSRLLLGEGSGAKRPSQTTNTIKLDRIPFDPCASIKRFDLCPFDQKNSTYLQSPDFLEDWILLDYSCSFSFVEFEAGSIGECSGKNNMGDTVACGNVF